MSLETKTHFTGLGPLPQPSPKPANHILDLFSLKGKVASVTGSSTGIGYAVAEAFAQAGADVALWYNSHNAEAKAKALSEKYGIKAKAYKVLVTDAAAVEAAIKEQIKEFGKIDIFVANAGVPWTAGPLIDTEDDSEWKKVIDLDFNGVYYCAKHIGRHFKERGSGSFIATSSMSGHIVNFPQMQAAYNAAKAGVRHFCASLAVEWAGFARVNSVSPGYIATEISDFVDQSTKSKWQSFTPLGREGEVQELVGAYLYLASNASTYTTGADIRVDGGYTAP
ncbi:hypothetical protein D0Z00_002484 [Geotrichum galactomycetum]|uniref:Uncharacterized protein n=1 Tax=Geotrichum galactomycetum TaxID=27317 RepID=A0ACB6V428_9ASCO|nr:hypothetical protein D0Z00_002484 [Geotrichum candidum]